MKAFRITLSVFVLVVLAGIYMLFAPASGEQSATDNSGPASSPTQSQSSDSGSYSGIGK